MTFELDKFNGWDESIVAKPNRRRRVESKTHRTIVGPPPPTGVHKASRKERDKLFKNAIEKYTS